jgi:hypothetical protein
MDFALSDANKWINDYFYIIFVTVHVIDHTATWTKQVVRATGYAAIVV